MSEFDAKARDWDSDPSKVERAGRVADAILDHVGPRAARLRGLDYGCGTGLLGFALQPSLAHVTLADTSKEMLAVLREKIAASGAGNMTPLELDLTVGAPPATRYDLLCTLMTLHHIPDIDAMLGRFHALLAPGGVLCISDLDAEDGSFHGPGFEGHRGFDRQDLGDRLRRAGFRNVRFSTPYVVDRSTAGGARRYPLFLAVADKD